VTGMSAKAAHATASAPVASYVVFGIFVVTMIVLAVLVIRFAASLGRRQGGDRPRKRIP